MADLIDIGNFEDASADLFVADVFSDACERYVNGARAEVNFAFDEQKSAFSERILNELMCLDTILFELRQQIAKAKGKMDAAIDEWGSAKRAEHAAGKSGS